MNFLKRISKTSPIYSWNFLWALLALDGTDINNALKRKKHKEFQISRKPPCCFKTSDWFSVPLDQEHRWEQVQQSDWGRNFGPSLTSSNKITIWRRFNFVKKQFFDCGKRNFLQLMEVFLIICESLSFPLISAYHKCVSKPWFYEALSFAAIHVRKVCSIRTNQFSWFQLIMN